MNVVKQMGLRGAECGDLCSELWKGHQFWCLSSSGEGRHGRKAEDVLRTELHCCDIPPQLTAFNVPSNLCRVGNGNEMLIKNLCITYS